MAEPTDQKLPEHGRAHVGAVREAPFDGVFVSAFLGELGAAVQACQRCDLWRGATQGVAGEGPAPAAVMLVGEQPGDREDQAGRPFVGPAGHLFDRSLAEAGLARADGYVTNAVKHFKFTARGKWRIHARPDAGEIEACRWWLDHVIRMVRPRAVVALGASAERVGGAGGVRPQRDRVEWAPAGGSAEERRPRVPG